MKILVLVKQAPDTEAKIEVSADGKSLDLSSVKYVLNPYDEFAVEEALKIKAEVGGDSEVIIASLGPAAARERMLKALAMGGDRGILVTHEDALPADSAKVADVLAALVKRESPELVLCGKQGIDDDNMHVPVMVAEALDWPHINVVGACKVSGSNVEVSREAEGGIIEQYSVALPAVLGANKSLNTPRYAALPGIMKAKKKPFEEVSVSDLGVTLGDSQIAITGYSTLPPKPEGFVFKDMPVEEMVDQLVDRLRNEAKAL